MMRNTAGPSLNEELLARMTGELGEPGHMRSIGRAVGERLIESMKIGFRRATGITLKIRVGAVTPGRNTDLLSGLGDGHVLCSATVENWSGDIHFAVDGRLVVMLTELLLGGDGKAPEAARPLTEIEKDVAAVVFEQAAIALRDAVAPGSDGRSGCGPVFEAPFKREDDSAIGDYAVALAMELEFARQTFDLQLIMPQRALLKTNVITAQTAETEATGPEWVEQLTRKVHTSGVDLEADIRLAPLSLGAASRLKPGDVLPFADEEEVRVLVKANGKNLFWGEFGKSDDRYMLRLKERYGGEADFIRNLAG